MALDDAFLHEGLFRIGDVANCCGVDRQTILFYERKGLMSHTLQNKSSGYRYYSTEAVTELMQILQLKNAGFSLKEIKDFMENGAPAAERVIAGMEKKLAALLAGLELARAISVRKGDYSVEWTQLPAMRCFVREYVCHGVEEARDRMHEAFSETLSRGMAVRDAYCIYAEYPEETGGPVNLDCFSMRVCIPVSPDSRVPECVDVAAVCGAAVCHRGDYAEIGRAYDALWKYVGENGLKAVGPVRESYLDSRKEYKNSVERYVTRLALPVERRP